MSSLIAASVIALLPGIQSPAVVRGIVVDPSGAPVSGAEVRIDEAVGAIRGEGRTAADGRFELEVPDGSHTLVVRAEGFHPHRQPIDAVDPPGALRITLAPASYTESLMVTARGQRRVDERAAPATVLAAADLALQASPVVDDALRGVPGFSLFRRSSSRVANPTTQGAGMRGLAASGASRAVVVADGAPLNDPFGGWVYWNRVPLAAIEKVEVARGAASDVVGADALTGVIQIVTGPGDRTLARAVVDGGSHQTGRASLFGGLGGRGWQVTASGEASGTDGVYIITDADRGAVDTRAGSDYLAGQAGVGYQAPSGWRGRVAGDAFGESRENGTVLQVNSTDIRRVRAELAAPLGGGELTVAGYGGSQVYRQTFSAVAADRQTETLTSRQRVPASHLGLSLGWARALSRQDVLTGVELRDVDATNHEVFYAPSGVVRSTTETPGFARSVGAYGQYRVQPGARWTLVGGLRADWWQPDRDVSDGPARLSPRVSASFAITPALALRAAVAGAFRAPSLNELYRGFRVGNVQTLPNADLQPETLTSVEASLHWSDAAGSLRATAFLTRLEDAVTNVTVSTTAALTIRRRQNVGAVRASGGEVEGEWRLGRALSAQGGLALLRSRFDDYVPLQGLTVPQVPRVQGWAGLRYLGPRGVTAAGQVRAFSGQWEDDRNTIRLNAGATLDAIVSQPIGRHAAASIAVENLTDAEYDVARTPVRTVGMPRTIRIGLRLFLP